MSNGWIQTRSGRKIEPLNLKPEDVLIEDVAAHLSKICRFTGAVSDFYSVAQHSVLVSVYCEPEDALWGLLHDASEYVLQDVPRPLKHLVEFAFYREAEYRAMSAICKAFGISEIQPASVGVADVRMLATEARDLMSPLHPEWRTLKTPYVRRIASWSPDQAEISFLRRFRALTENPEQAHADAMAYRQEAA
jgi:hypothetical protein